MSNIILPKLISLDLSKNLMSTLAEGDLVHLDQVKNLTLTRCSQLTRIYSGVFGLHNSLHYLNFSTNPKLSTMDPESLVNLKSLTTLDLSGNQLSTVTLPLITSLKKVNANNNPWRCDCRLLSLQKQLKLQLTPSQALCAKPSHLSEKSVTKVELRLCEKHFSEEFSEDANTFPRHYLFYPFITVACLSIVIMILISLRKKLKICVDQIR